MATKRIPRTQPVRQYESNLGLNGGIKTDIYTTNPKTIITLEGSISDKDILDLRFLVDGFLKEKGY